MTSIKQQQVLDAAARRILKCVSIKEHSQWTMGRVAFIMTEALGKTEALRDLADRISSIAVEQGVSKKIPPPKVSRLYALRQTYEVWKDEDPEVVEEAKFSFLEILRHEENRERRLSLLLAAQAENWPAPVLRRELHHQPPVGQVQQVLLDPYPSRWPQLRQQIRLWESKGLIKGHRVIFRKHR